jgi:hypothetical protein
MLIDVLLGARAVTTSHFSAMRVNDEFKQERRYYGNASEFLGYYSMSMVSLAALFLES